MNFDFLRELKGLKTVYPSCRDAEELVIAKPYLSMTASRKSAELLAKFIYLAAHAGKMEGLTFADILADPQVKSFVHDRDIMDAFHFIRKSGNKAVHGEEEISTDNALAVLQNLHFIAGEIAKHFSLIIDYPEFNANIKSNPYAVLHECEDLSAEAINMFLQYLQETKTDIEEHIDRHFPVDESKYDTAHYGTIDFHEQIIFDHGLWGKVCELKRRELFTYKQIIQYTDPFDFDFHHVNKGRELTTADIFTEDFLEIQEGHLWTNEWITLSIDFDFDEHPEIVEAIQNAVRGFLQGYELSLLEDEWKNEEYQLIFSGTCLLQIDIHELQTMLEKINQALLPVIGNCSADTKEAWLYDYEGFGIAKILWADEGFFIAGGIM